MRRGEEDDLVAIEGLAKIGGGGLLRILENLLDLWKNLRFPVTHDDIDELLDRSIKSQNKLKPVAQKTKTKTKN